jgi:hypothetical protein
MTREPIPSITSGPKGRDEFHELVCVWTNLFLTCTKCNSAKGEQWDEALLRPDEPGFSFERYFELRFDSWELHPATAATAEDQLRARKTIDVLDLNRSGALKSRRRFNEHFKLAAAHGAVGDLDDWPYRYLFLGRAR